MACEHRESCYFVCDRDEKPLDVDTKKLSDGKIIQSILPACHRRIRCGKGAYVPYTAPKIK